MERALPLLTALVPLAIAPGLLFYFDVTPKVVLLLIGCSAVLLTRVDLAHLLRRRRGVVFTALLALQLAFLALATALSTNPGLSLAGSNWRRLGLVTHGAILLLALFAAGGAARDASKWIALLRATCIAGLAAAVYGCAQYFGIDPWLPVDAYHIGEGEFTIVRPPSTLGHASYAASFYLQAIFAGVALVLAGQPRLWRNIGWMTALVCSAAIVLSGTRGAMVGWLAGAVTLALLVRPALSWKRVGLAAAIVLASAAFYVAPPGQKLRSRTRWYVEDPRGGARLELWRDAARMGAARWPQGWGPETFVTEFPRYQSRELARAFPDFYHESPHNIFLEAWTAQGILGLLIMAGFCGLALRTRRGSPVQAALCAGFAALTVSLQFVSFTAPTAFGFYVTLGLLVALDSPDRERAPVFVPRLIAIPACLAVFAYALQLTATDASLESVSRLLEARHLSDAERVYQRTLGWQPVGPTSDLWFARALTDAGARSNNPVERLASIEIARQSASRATQRAEDRHNAYYTLAQIHALQEDLPGVEKYLRQTIAVAPMWFKPHWTLAEALELADRHAEARKEALIAFDLDAGKDTEVRATLDRLGGP